MNDVIADDIITRNHESRLFFKIGALPEKVTGTFFFFVYGTNSVVFFENSCLQLLSVVVEFFFKDISAHHYKNSK